MTTSGIPLFGRYFRLILGTIDVNQSLRCTFNVTRTVGPTPNKAEIAISNLSAASIAQIEQAIVLPVQLDAGYQQGHQTLFLGDLRASGTIKEDDGSWTTTIRSGDGETAIRTSRVSKSVAKGAPPDSLFRAVALSVGVDPGNIDEAAALVKSRFGGNNPFPFGTVVTGSAARELSNLCRTFGLEWSIQNGKLQFTERGKPTKGAAVLLSEATGMVGFPSVDAKGTLLVTSLLNPDLAPGKLLVLESARLKGGYRIEECSYGGDTHSTSNWTVAVKASRY